MKHYIYMAVTADKYELPLVVGTALTVAKWAGTNENNVRVSIYNQVNGAMKGYKFVKVEDTY